MRTIRQIAKIAIFVIVYSVIANGTTVVVMRTRSRVVIGADSLGFMNARGVAVCKIQHDPSRRVAFAAAGLAYFVVVGGGDAFDAYRLADMAISRTTKIQDAARTFEALGIGPFRKVVETIRRRTPKDFRKLRESPNPLEVAFAGVENGSPLYVISSFSISGPDNRPSITTIETSCPGASCPGNPNGTTVLGVKEGIVKLVADPKFWIRFNDPLSAIRAMIEAEIRDRPDAVGAPVSILDMETAGSYWKEKGYCQ